MALNLWKDDKPSKQELERAEKASGERMEELKKSGALDDILATLSRDVGATKPVLGDAITNNDGRIPKL